MRLIQGIKNFVSKSFEAPYESNRELVVLKGWEELKSNTVSMVSDGGSGTLAPTITVNQALNRYRSWVYPCVDIISKEVSGIPFYLYKEIGKPNDEEFEKIYDHPVVKLLNRPNKFMSGKMFRNVIQKHLDLTGMAFARILRNGVGQPAELHILPPHELVHIEYGGDTNEIIKKFVFNSQLDRFKKIELYWEEVLYFWYPHPKHIYMPYSVMQSLANIVDMAMYMEIYQKDFFANNARPDFVILVENDLNEPKAKRIQESWLSKFRGPGNQHKPAVLGPNVKIQPLGIPAKDFEFANTADFTREHILAHFHVPAAKLGIVNETSKAGIVATDTVFANECITPRLDIFTDTINIQLMSQYRNSDGFSFKFESPLPKDEEWDLTKNQGELTLGLTTQNEIRKRKGQKPFKSKLADVPWVNGMPLPGEDEEADALFQKQNAGGAALTGGMPGEIPASNDPTAQGAMGDLGGRPEGTMLSSMLGEALRSSSPSLSSLLNASRGKRGGLSALLQTHPELISFNQLLQNDRYNQGLTKLLTKGIEDYIISGLNEEDKIIFKTYEDTIAKVELLEDDYQEEAKNFFVKKGIQFGEIVTKKFDDFVTKGNDFDFDISEEELKEDYKKTASGYITKACEFGYFMGFELVKKAKQVREPNVAEQASIEAAGRFLEKSAELKVKSTKKLLTKIIQEGLKEGLDSERVSQNIMENFKEIGYARASMIARTELSAAVWAGLDASYETINKEADKIIVTKSLIWTALNERVCPECKDEHGKLAKDYKTGEVKQDGPLHPNCLCFPKPEYE